MPFFLWQLSCVYLPLPIPNLKSISNNFHKITYKQYINDFLKQLKIARPEGVNARMGPAAEFELEFHHARAISARRELAETLEVYGAVYATVSTDKTDRSQTDFYRGNIGLYGDAQSGAPAAANI